MKQLFDKYTAAFDALKASEIAKLYKLPCATSDGDGQAVFTTESSLIDKFDANCNTMIAMGYSHSQYNIINQEMLGEGACAVTIGWKVFTKSAPIEFRSHYVCHKVDDQWKIFTAQVFSGTFN